MQHTCLKMLVKILTDIQTGGILLLLEHVLVVDEVVASLESANL